MRTRLGLLACAALSCGALVLALGGEAAVARTDVKNPFLPRLIRR